jgi:hypothetical protein
MQVASISQCAELFHLVRMQQRSDAFTCPRRAEQKALHLVALDISKQTPLLSSLDAFRGGNHFVLRRHCHDGSYNA